MEDQDLDIFQTNENGLVVSIQLRGMLYINFGSGISTDAALSLADEYFNNATAQNPNWRTLRREMVNNGEL